AAIWRRKWIILPVMALSLFATYRITERMPHQYRSSAQVMVNQPGPTVASSPDAVFNAPLMETTATQVTLLESDAMAGKTYAWLKNQALAKGNVRDDLGMVDDRHLWKEFPKIVKIANPENTNIINVTVTAGTPEVAAGLADAICEAFVDWKRQLAQERAQ